MVTTIGRYQIVDRLGAGGFATVYRAHDPELDSAVAIKVLADNWSGDAELRERFLREARLLRRIDSDRVITIHDVGELPTGQPYLVMALAPGGTLDDRLDRAAATSEEIAAIGVQVAACLRVVHGNGLIHRDVKPSNLLLAGGADPGRGVLGPSERLVLADFGLAKDLGLQQSVDVTISAGTRGYAAPEQMTLGGRPSARTDLYAATGVMYRVLSGHPPPVFDDIRQVVHFTDGPWMAGRLGQFFQTGMAFHPDHRHPDIEAWLHDLSSALAANPAPTTRYLGQVPSSPPPGQAPTLPRPGSLPPVGSSVPPVSGPSSGPGPLDVASSTPRPSGGRGTSGRSSGRWVLAALLVVAAVVAAGWYVLIGGERGPEVVGPTELEAGETHVFEARLEEADRFEWTDWDGQTVEQDGFRVDAVAPGSLVFSVVGIDGDGDRSPSTEHRITIVEAENGPEIVGPDQAPLGQATIYTFTAPAGATNPRWIDANGEQQGEQLTIEPVVAGTYRVTLIVTLPDGTDIGTSREITLVES